MGGDDLVLLGPPATLPEGPNNPTADVINICFRRWVTLGTKPVAF